ncbi:hypothetical protein DACRYDRAFT_19694 [Dacryopinax primogenitus]|uniref:Uncharacterized protein n=1 Tax=Dacryopinax primogenitus (strain DJM 731) TaxID=1858805 RepID=M5GD60_DACPD|nr:uncharacterized protein DACRYDRAFT_19694 [Dacryopinax primogenitus]EJU06620.1 hypothetical protein DACRYDRAFT_19694 [Dacryopinax primogenitus]
MTTYVSFEYLTILGSNMVGSLVLQSQDASGVFHYAVLPLAKGDTATNVANTGLVFMDGQDFTKLDNQIVDFKIASGTGGTAPSSCVVSFFGNGNIATLTLTNGQLGWMGASGKCTFFQTPAPPGSAPKPKAV